MLPSEDAKVNSFHSKKPHILRTRESVMVVETGRRSRVRQNAAGRTPHSGECGYGELKSAFWRMWLRRVAFDSNRRVVYKPAVETHIRLANSEFRTPDQA